MDQKEQILEKASQILHNVRLSDSAQAIQDGLLQYLQLIQAHHEYPIEKEKAEEAAITGVHAYRNKEWITAECFFASAAMSGCAAAKVNLAYMIRRREISEKSGLTLIDALVFLRDEVAQKDGFALVNTALIYALNLDEPRHWHFADQLFSLVQKEDADAIMQWWKNVEEKERYVVELFLLRHGLLDESTPERVVFMYDEVKSVYADVPGWLIRTREETT